MKLLALIVTLFLVSPAIAGNPICELSRPFNGQTIERNIVVNGRCANCDYVTVLAFSPQFGQLDSSVSYTSPTWKMKLNLGDEPMQALSPVFIIAIGTKLNSEGKPEAQNMKMVICYVR